MIMNNEVITKSAIFNFIQSVFSNTIYSNILSLANLYKSLDQFFEYHKSTSKNASTISYNELLNFFSQHSNLVEFIYTSFIQ